MTLVRKGECKRCGQCCRAMFLAVLGDDVQVEWLRARGLTIHPSPDPDFYDSVEIPQVCANLHHYQPDGAICGLHDDGKPIACRDWPHIPADLETVRDCGFYFEEAPDA